MQCKKRNDTIHFLIFLLGGVAGGVGGMGVGGSTGAVGGSTGAVGGAMGGGGGELSNCLFQSFKEQFFVRVDFFLGLFSQKLSSKFIRDQISQSQEYITRITVFSKKNYKYRRKKVQLLIRQTVADYKSFLFISRSPISSMSDPIFPSRLDVN